jgi:hypothetical protein
MAFLHRSGLVPCHVNPEPRISPQQLLIHRLPLQPPLPLPELQGYLDNEPQAPDRGVSQAWPHPEVEDETE